MVMIVTLCTADGEALLDDPDENLIGTKVTGPNVLFDDCGNPGCFFIFTDLSIRNIGEYRLRYDLVQVSE